MYVAGLENAKRKSEFYNAKMTENPPARWLIILAFASIYISWGTTYKAMEIGVREERLPPFLFGGVRILTAGVLLLTFQALRGNPVRVTGRHLVFLLIAGLLMFVGGNGFITLGLRTVPSGLTSVLAATAPLWMAFFALLLPHGDRLRPRGWAGLLLGLFGVFLLLALTKPIRSDEPLVWSDFAFCLTSAASWGIGSLLVRHFPVDMPRMTSASYQMILGGAAQALVGMGLGELANVPPISTRAMGAFFYLLLVGSLWGFIAFSWLLAHAPAAQVGTYAYVNPVIAILIGTFFGETITMPMVGAMGMILMAVFMVRGSEIPHQPTVIPDEEPA